MAIVLTFILIFVGFFLLMFFAFSFKLIIIPYEMAKDTKSPVGGIRTIGVSFVIVGVLAVWFVYLLIDRLLEPSAEDWMWTGVIMLGIVAFLVFFIGVGLVKGLTVNQTLCALFKFMTEKETEPKTTKKQRKVMGIVAMVVGVLLCVWIVGICAANNTSDNGYTCSVCDRTFASGSSDARSIAESNMCNNCHDNFLWGQDVLNEIDGKNN